MSNLRVYNADSPQSVKIDTNNGEEISEHLQARGVRFERWQADAQISDSASQDEIHAAYKTEIESLMKDNGYKSFDIINMQADHEQKDILREKFFAEHTHSEDEVRFFVKGKGLFTLHIEDEVFEVTCEKEDLISVPAGTPHWFDMGSQPSFTCIRVFDSKDGWVADYTGSKIAENFSKLP